MITTITLNPAIDKLYMVEDFTIHKLHRLDKEEKSITMPGGKGINVAISLQKLGIDTIAMGFAGGHPGRMLAEEIRKEGVTTNFIHTETNTRTDISIIDKKNNTLSEINESGEKISKIDMDLFMENFKKILNQTSLLILAGSIPPKTPNDIYGTLVKIAQEKNVPAIVHTTPKYIEDAIEAEAFCINPDMRSFHSLFGTPLDGIEQFLKIGKEIVKKNKGTEVVFFSHRIENMVAITKKISYILRPQKLNIVNMLGYGDAVISGFTYGLNEKMNLKDALHFACSSGLTNVESLEKQVADIDLIKKNLKRVTIEEV